MEDAEPVKVFVLGDDRKATAAGKIPDRLISGPKQAGIADMYRPGKNVGDRGCYASRQILVNEKRC